MYEVVYKSKKSYFGIKIRENAVAALQGAGL